MLRRPIRDVKRKKAPRKKDVRIDEKRPSQVQANHREAPENPNLGQHGEVKTKFAKNLAA